MGSGRVDGRSAISLEVFRSDLKSDMEIEFIRWKVNMVGEVRGFGIICIERKLECDQR